MASSERPGPGEPASISIRGRGASKRRGAGRPPAKWGMGQNVFSKMRIDRRNPIPVPLKEKEDDGHTRHIIFFHLAAGIEVEPPAAWKGKEERGVERFWGR